MQKAIKLLYLFLVVFFVSTEVKYVNSPMKVFVLSYQNQELNLAAYYLKLFTFSAF